MKKFLALLLVAVLAFTALACKATPAAETTAPDATATDAAAATAPVAETNADRETVNVRFAQFGNSIDDVDGMSADPIKKSIESAVNVTLEYDTGTDGFDDRMQTELYTGGAPDLFPTWGETDKITKWVSEDLVYNLSDIVNAAPDRYPTLFKIMNTEEYKMYNKLYTGDENKAYAIYSIAAFADPAYSGISVYNQAILDAVNGGKVPQTVDEFLTYASAAGQNSYVGWWPRNDKLTNWNEIDKTIAAPQGTSILAPSGDVWNGFVLSGDLGTDSEKWTLATTSDASKEVVKQLAELYKSGGLDSGIGVKSDFDDAYADFGLGKIGAMNFGFGYPGQFRDFYKECWLAANPSAKMSDLTLGVALTDEGNNGHTYTTGTWVGAHYFIPTSCAYPERVLDLVEYLASAAGQDLLHNTTNYVYNDAQGVDFWNSATAPYGYGDGRCKYVWFSYLFSGTEYEVDFTNNDWWTAVSKPIDNSNNWATDEDKALVDYAKSVLSGYTDKAVVQLPAYYGLIVLPAEAADIRTKLQEVTNQYLTQMLGGQLDVETAWPEYVAAYEAAGAADLETMVNDAIATARAAQ